MNPKLETTHMENEGPCFDHFTDQENLVSETKGRQIEQGKDTFELQIKTLLYNIEKDNKRLTIKTSDCLYITPINDIIRCEAQGNYTVFFLVDGTKILVSTTLKEYDEVLTQYQFFRLHKSHLVNLKWIGRYNKKFGGSVIMRDKSTVPVSTRKKEKLFELLETL